MPAVNSNYAGKGNSRYNGNSNGNYSRNFNGSGNPENGSRYNESNSGRGRGGYNNYGGDRNARGQRDDFMYEITDSYGALSISSTGWTKELNRVSWNGNAPKFDIREWSPDHGRMRRGVTFTEEEALELRDLLEKAIADLPVSAFSSTECTAEGDSADGQETMFENTDGLDSGPLADDGIEDVSSDTNASHDAA